MPSKVRLYVDHPLAPGQSVPLSQAQANYLFAVMRLGPGAAVTVFNGRDGEWDATVTTAGKRGGTLTAVARTRPLMLPPDLWFVFAPVKKARTDFIVEKAVEMGVARILPVTSDHSNTERVNTDRLQAHAVEAAEQCGATFVPPVDPVQPLARLLDHWPEGRDLWFCDEDMSLEASPGPATLHVPLPSAILIGPEGGFSPAERRRLRHLTYALPVRLGPRILRADTAAVAALALWQVSRGDWR
jgi:16S rRNA (uracil1498-N3)-methyltransferase